LSEAEAEAEKIHREVQAKFEAERRSRMEAAHEAARILIEKSRRDAEEEALKIADAAKREREKMREHFNEGIDALTSALAEETAVSLVASAKSAKEAL
jgi:vacuolar-type H+-ATPase subunit E/Vma4